MARKYRSVATAYTRAHGCAVFIPSYSVLALASWYVDAPRDAPACALRAAPPAELATREKKPARARPARRPHGQTLYFVLL